VAFSDRKSTKTLPATSSVPQLHLYPRFSLSSQLE
jgi:hypothetical protein